MANAITVLYRIPAPYSFDDIIEVYGEPEMGWYEWRLVSNGRITQDTKNTMYGSAEIALRDALIDTSK